MTSKSSSEFTVFVGGLANHTTNRDLLAYFSAFGNIARCEVQMWKNNPTKCRGFALVTAADKPTYEKVLATEHKLGGRYIECKKMIKDKSELQCHSKNEVEKKIFVSGLSKKVTEEQFKAYFALFGEVKIAYIVKHHKDLKSKGFGFVSFSDKRCKQVLLDTPEHIIEGKQVICSEYSTKFDLKKASGPKTNCFEDISSDNGEYNFPINTTTSFSDSDPNELRHQERVYDYSEYSGYDCGNVQHESAYPSQYSENQFVYENFENRYTWNCDNHCSTQSSRRQEKAQYNPFVGSNLFQQKLAQLFSY